MLNGTLIGASVGFAAGFLTVVVVEANGTASGPVVDAESIGSFVIAGVLGAGIGAGIGAIVDGVKKDIRLSGSVNRPFDIKPMLGRIRRGVSFSIIV